MLQPIVENSVNHGYEHTVGVMRISVAGYLENGWWVIRIRDNGQGFSDQKIDEISRRMQSIKREIMEKNSSLEMEIGGMGLINTYARLVLLYGDQCIFMFGNHKDGGAEVTIGALCSDGACGFDAIGIGNKNPSSGEAGKEG
jgi:two-component system sensor histidine kinase YesM